jgi:twitching motility protein PilT
MTDQPTDKPPSPTASTMHDKVYALSPSRLLSMGDLLTYFQEQGSLRVSDLHLKVGSPPVYRTDGRLTAVRGQPLDEATVRKLAAAILSPAELALVERDHSVDSSYLSDKMQFRLNCFYDNDGPALAIRALEPAPLPVESIGFPNRVWEDIVAKQFGLVLLTGITGAGKSTTVASLVDRIAKTRPCRILTLEDPIEYRLLSQQALVSQREVGRHVESFERGLRDCLREDPDVIVVGEMRDRESARWTLTAAETGHLVFSTLHTRDVRGSVTRLLDMVPAPQQEEVASQLSLGLSHILSQKLIPRADGQGRVVAMEILNNSYAVQNLIRTGKIEQLYSLLQIRTRDIPEERMVTMEQSLAHLVHRKVVTAQEAERWANHPAEFVSALRHLQTDAR